VPCATLTTSIWQIGESGYFRRKDFTTILRLLIKGHRRVVVGNGPITLKMRWPLWRLCESGVATSLREPMAHTISEVGSWQRPSMQHKPRHPDGHANPRPTPGTIPAIPWSDLIKAARLER